MFFKIWSNKTSWCFYNISIFLCSSCLDVSQSKIKQTNVFFFDSSIRGLRDLKVVFKALFVTILEGSFIKRQTSGTSSNNNWYNEWQPMTSDNKWQRVLQRVTMNDNEWQSGITNDNKRKWVVQQETANENELQRVTISAKFSFFQIREESTTNHCKKNSLNIQ